MIKRGTAFRCYMTADEQEAARTQAHAEGRAIRSPYRDGKGAVLQPMRRTQYACGRRMMAMC